MHTWVARALVQRLLFPDQKEKVRDFEAHQNPSGRLLSASEIVRQCNLKTKAVAEYEIQAMTALFQDWEKRVLWKQRQIDDKKHDTICQGIPAGQWCRCVTPWAEIHQWEDYAMTHYVKPRPPRDESDAGDDLVKAPRKPMRQETFSH